MVPTSIGKHEKKWDSIFRSRIFEHTEKVTFHVLFSGALAMEALHRQVLPFLLRRMKEDVLKDLPPKIIQDYYCDVSPLQVGFYQLKGVQVNYNPF